MKEIRNNELINSTNSESRLVEGYAVVFNSRSQLLRDKNGEPFYEEIEPNALNGVIERSDVVCLLNHDMNRGVLARSRKGEGSLSLSIDSRGLKFSFQAPNSSLGDEILEYIKRKDITQCSFGFTIQDDEFVYTDNSIIPLRKINQIDYLYDISLVFTPAYEETTVDLRSLNSILNDSNSENNENNINVQMNEETRNQNELEPSLDVENRNDEVTETEDNKEEKEQNEESREAENDSDEEKETSDNEQSEEMEEKSNDCENEKDEKRNINVIKKPNHNIMNKRNFSLLQTINSIANNRAIDSVAESVIAEGRSAANKAGITPTGQIQISLEPEKRFEDNPNGILASQNTEALTYGGEAVPTSTYDVLGALRDRLIVSQLGAKMLNLSGNVEIPVYDGANCTWESEIGDAQDGSGKFRTVKLTPKRLTAYLPISKQFLNQTSASAEALLRSDLVDCIAEKLQATLFGDGAGSDVEPTGLFNGVVAETGAFKFEDAVAMEELLELNNVYGEKKYVVSPSTKAILRTTPIDAGSGRMVMENNEVLGIPAYSTSSVTGKGIILGDWSNLYIANFGSLDLTVDTVTRARNAQIVLVVNAWFDYAVVRPEAFVKKVLA